MFSDILGKASLIAAQSLSGMGWDTNLTNKIDRWIDGWHDDGQIYDLHLNKINAQCFSEISEFCFLFCHGFLCLLFHC